MEKAAKLSPPWITFYKKIVALFKDDPRVRIDFNNEDYTLKLFVEGEAKAEALTRLLPTEKEFGNVVVKVEVIPANLVEDNPVALYEAAFEGNPVLSYTKSVSGFMVDNINYVVFKKKVVQFYNDALDDINGNETTLYEDIAKDVFTGSDMVFFCTDTEEE